MSPFKALRVHAQGPNDSGGGDQIVARFETLELDDLSPGDVVIRGCYSSINYKDALAATGAGKILRTFPLVAGVDVAGTVLSSADSRFRVGQEVLVTGSGLGETRDGGFAETVRVPGDAVIPMPDTLSLRDGMAIGTAGFTAALAIHRMEKNEQRPELGPVAITGASGGVGSFAIDLLSSLGYSVTALSRKKSARNYLEKLGASEVLSPEQLKLDAHPLDKAIWGGAVDNLDGPLLSWILGATRSGGNVASVGLAASPKLETTVFPFILRGVNLLGINSVDTPRAERLEVWRRLASDLRPRHLDAIVTREVSLDDLPACFGDYVAGKVQGRTVVRLTS